MATSSWRQEKENEFNINRKIFVGNISYRIKSGPLSKFFSKFGRVETCHIVQDHLKHWSRGIGFITFCDEQSMMNALAATEEQLVLDSRMMRVKPAELSHKTTYWQEEGVSKYANDIQNEEGVADYANDMQIASTETNHPADDKEQSSSNINFEQTSSDAVTMSELYDDVLIQIFCLLWWKERLGVERVCTRWRNLVQKTWHTQKTLAFNNVFKRFGGLTDWMLNIVLEKFGRYLHTLDLSGSPRLLTDFSLDIIGKHCPDVLDLDLTSVKITNVSVKKLVTKCKKLKKIKLKQSVYVTDKGLRDLLQGCPELTHLDLTDMHAITGHCFSDIGNKLESLLVPSCYKLSDRSIHNMVTRCPLLQELNISHCRQLTNNAIRVICQNCSHLKILRFSAAYTIVESEALKDLKKLSELEFLDLSTLQIAADSTLNAISEGCPQLSHINISSCHGITDIGIIALQKLTNLHNLNISYLTQITDVGISTITKHGILQELVARATKCMTDEVVISLAACCPSLHHLDVSGCFQISNTIFQAFQNSYASEDNRCIEMYVGGTSIDWVGDDLDWVNGMSHLKVSMHNLAMADMTDDTGMLVLPSEVYDDAYEAENQFAPHPPLSELIDDAPVEGFDDDWDEDYYDGYLDNDDPLEHERWEMS